LVHHPPRGSSKTETLPGTLSVRRQSPRKYQRTPAEAVTRDIILETALRVEEVCKVNVADVATEADGRVYLTTTVTDGRS
jgi:hypothetical protein